MNSITLTIPLLLLFVGAISFWILVESKVWLPFKLLVITLFCSFVISFYSSIPSFLGWAAFDSDIPKVLTLYSVIIKEPNANLNNKGRIYVLADDGKGVYSNRFLELMKYYTNNKEPRLFSIPYSRSLHENLQQNVVPRLQKGQRVTGKFSKPKNGENGDGQEKGKKLGAKADKQNGKGNDKSEKQNGSGSESLEQEWKFYELKPSEISPKIH